MRLSISAWASAVVIGLALVGGSQASDQSGQSNRASAVKSAPAPPPPAVAAVAAPAGPPDAPKWTDQIIALSALGTLAFTGVLAWSTVALWRSTKHLAEGAEAQGKDITVTAAAAKKSADVAERALYATQRAYVAVTPRFSIELNEPGGPVMAVGFWMSMENHGNTPTVHMVNKTSAAFLLKADGVEYTYDRAVGQEAAEIPTTLGIRTATTTDKQVFSRGHIEKVIDGSAELFLSGWVEYNDVFDGTPRHGVEWCFKVAIEGRLVPDQCQARFDSQPEHNRLYDCPPEPARSSQSAMVA